MLETKGESPSLGTLEIPHQSPDGTLAITTATSTENSKVELMGLACAQSKLPLKY